MVNLASACSSVEAAEGRAPRGRRIPTATLTPCALFPDARRKAGLPEHVTLTACRHGGMTELGDASLTEQGVMALPLASG